MKFEFDWPCNSENRCLKIIVINMYLAPGRGRTVLLGQNIFININHLSIRSLAASFSH